MAKSVGLVLEHAEKPDSLNTIPVCRCFHNIHTHTPLSAVSQTSTAPKPQFLTL